jgi:hypothetical protein
MNAVLSVLFIGVGVLFAFLIGYARGRRVDHDRLVDENVLCYECRSRVDPDYIERHETGNYPVCPVCDGNMIPPVGARRTPQYWEGT